jgi:hypothetical protein
MKFNPPTSKLFAVLLAICVSGFADLAQAAQSTTTQPQDAQQQQTTAPGTQSPAVADPAQQVTVPATQSPAATDPNQQTATPAELPNAPSATAPSAQTAPAQEQSSSSQSQNGAAVQQSPTQNQPLGAAAAQKGVTSGGAASRPAGTAIAGAKQRQSRSFLIKLGAVAAAGIALGTVYALTRGTPSVPPGAAAR